MSTIKPAELMTSHLSKSEIETRKKAENKLKCNDNKVYITPKDITPEEQLLYKSLASELKASNILSNLDIPLLKTTVNAINLMNKCRQDIAVNGLLLKKEDGSTYRNPSTTIFKDYNVIFNKCQEQLGLSPQARAKLAQLNIKAQEEAEDPVLKLLM